MEAPGTLVFTHKNGHPIVDRQSITQVGRCGDKMDMKGPAHPPPPPLGPTGTWTQAKGGKEGENRRGTKLKNQACSVGRRDERRRLSCGGCVIIPGR